MLGKHEIKVLIIKTIIEDLGQGALLCIVCAVGIRKGAVGMSAAAAGLSAVMMLFVH